MLHAPRKGWQNEHLGLHLLSKIAFCANPVTVSDDLGSDYFCCLFKVVGRGKSKSIVPLNSFAIQVKSSAKAFPVSDKIDYLADLELPYFVGVVDQRKFCMEVYSGEYLPMLFSELGSPNISRLRIVPTRRRIGTKNYYKPYGRSGVRLFFPRVAVLEGRSTEGELRRLVASLHALCRRIHGNIATRRADEHIYEIPTKRQFYMMAGSGSARVFRENFYKRLAEVCFNFAWLLRSPNHNVDPAEVELYLALIGQLRRRNGRLPPYVNRAVTALKRELGGQSV